QVTNLPVARVEAVVVGVVVIEFLGDGDEAAGEAVVVVQTQGFDAVVPPDAETIAETLATEGQGKARVVAQQVAPYIELARFAVGMAASRQALVVTLVVLQGIRVGVVVEPQTTEGFPLRPALFGGVPAIGRFGAQAEEAATIFAQARFVRSVASTQKQLVGQQGGDRFQLG